MWMFREGDAIEHGRKPRMTEDGCKCAAGLDEMDVADSGMDMD